MIDVPEQWLAERSLAGIDRWDEMWEGVLHMVPPPSGEHQRLGMELALVLAPLAKAAGLVGSYETGLFRPGVDDDYRVPDQVYARPEHLSHRGVDGRAELVVEIRSPDDETYDKLAFYAAVGVPEVLVVHPEDRRAELFVLGGGSYVPAVPDPDGGVTVRSLGLGLVGVDGPRLRLTWDGGQSDL